MTGEVDQRTLDRLAAMTSEPTDAELHNRANQPGALDPRCRVGRVICVDKTSSTLRWVVDGTVLQTLDARFGASTTPTREGVFHVYLKDAQRLRPDLCKLPPVDFAELEKWIAEQMAHFRK